MENQIRVKLGAISKALEAGNKLEAIVLYRELTGADFEVAKEAIESICESSATDVSEDLSAKSDGWFKKCRQWFT